MKKIFFNIAVIFFVFHCISCEAEVSNEGVVFLNFSAQNIKELTAYNTEAVRVGSTTTYIQKEAVYNYEEGIDSNDYHAFELPMSKLQGSVFLFEIITEEGVLKRRNFDHRQTSRRPTCIVFSVHYELSYR